MTTVVTVKTYASAYAPLMPEDHRDALRAAAAMVVDHIFEDLQSVDGAQRPDWNWLQVFLPEAYLHRYDVMFAQRFLVSVVSVGLKLAQDEPTELSSVAEELALNAIIDQAEAWLDVEGKKADFELFRDEVYQDFDFELLLSPEFDGVEYAGIIAAGGMANLSFKDWFKPFDNAPPVHPYVDEPQEQEAD